MEQEDLDQQSDRHRRLIHLLFVITAGFAAVAITLVYWGVLQTQFLNERLDNPRNIEQTLRIRRGSIVDTQEIVLAYNGGSAERQERIYPLAVAEPVIGYYSVRHGTAGVEQALDDVLAGTTTDAWETHWRSLFNRPQVGRDVRLTLDITLQANTSQLLKDKRGAAILMGTPGGAIRVMSSMPTFDPNTLDETFDLLVEREEAPLLNRVAQGVYQPGEILLPFLAAAAIDQSDMSAEEAAEGFDGATLGPLLERRWVTDDLLQAWALFGFDEAPSIPLPVQGPAELLIETFPEALVGADVFTVTPLQVALAAAALGNDGAAVSPQLVSAVREGERWQAFNQNNERTPQVILPKTANAIVTALTVKDENVAEWETAVQAGPETFTSWYVGLFPANDPRFVVVIVLEDEPDPRIAREIGRRLLLLTLK